MHHTLAAIPTCSNLLHDVCRQDVARAMGPGGVTLRGPVLGAHIPAAEQPEAEPRRQRAEQASSRHVTQAAPPKEGETAPQPTLTNAQAATKPGSNEDHPAAAHSPLALRVAVGAAPRILDVPQKQPLARQQLHRGGAGRFY